MARLKSSKAKGGEGVAVGYVRVSTVGQAVDGLSLDAQRARIEAAAEYDMAFYAAAKRRFDADLAAFERQSTQAKKEAP